MQNKGNEDSRPKGMGEKIAGNKKAERWKQKSGPLWIGKRSAENGRGDRWGARDSWWGMMIVTSCG